MICGSINVKTNKREKTGAVGIFLRVVNYFLIGGVVGRKGNVGAGNKALFYPAQSTGCGCRYTGEPEWIECRQTPFVVSPKTKLDRLCAPRMFALPRPKKEARHCVWGNFVWFVPVRFCSHRLIKSIIYSGIRVKVVFSGLERAWSVGVFDGKLKPHVRELSVAPALCIFASINLYPVNVPTFSGRSFYQRYNED